ncbi:MAG: hypothetical protein H0U74_23345 [Bradymonadaceae bacterium]|nr:hypothetical protein [Lujinxingiaceae bacterium]
MLKRIVFLMFVALFLSLTACPAEPEVEGTPDVASNNTEGDTSQPDTDENNTTADTGNNTNPDTDDNNTNTNPDTGDNDTGGEAANWCPSYRVPTEQLCREHDDCTDNQGHCYPPGLNPSCGACFQTARDCESTDAKSCGEGELCESYHPECPCDGEELSTRCVVDCRDDASVCDDSQKCNDEGFCVVLRCDTDTVSCPTDASCTPNDAASDKHGCLRKSCEADDDCSCGACVFGRCFEGPGRCELPRP